MRRALHFHPRRLLVVAFLAAVLALPATAHAWWQVYSNDTWFGSGGFNYSSWQAGLNWNAISWVYGIAHLSLCNTSNQCYDYKPVYNGYGTDYRTIAYGKAKCQNPNGYDIYVDFCQTDNEH